MFLIFLFQACVIYEEKCPNCRVTEEVCDGLDNDANGIIDDGFTDVDADGIADCVDLETCDGVDNTGEGDIDEAFPDVDTDGTPDCLDSSCDLGLELSPEGFDYGCSHVSGGVLYPWQWISNDGWPGNSNVDYHNVVHQPWVVDLDGDGTSEIVLLAADSDFSQSKVHMLSGSDLSLVSLFTSVVLDPFSDLQVVLADSNTTGGFFVLDSDDRPTLLSNSGAVQWRSDTVLINRTEDVVPSHSTFTAQGDLDDDGRLELVYANHVIDAQSGALNFKLSETESETAPLVFNFGQYGDVLAYAGVAYDGTGTEIMESGLSGDSIWHAPIETNGDSVQEWLVVTENSGVIIDDSGSVVFDFDPSGVAVGPPCVGNLDSDSEQEFAVPVKISDQSSLIRIWDPQTGISVLGPSMASEFLAACSLMDVNADGIDEIFWRNQSRVMLFSSSGDELNSGGRDSGPTFSYPVLVDANGDNTVELFVGSTQPSPNLQGRFESYAHIDSNWPPGLTFWHGHAHRPRNVDYAFPQFRGQPAQPDHSYDWTLSVLDSCAAACSFDKNGAVRFQVQNRGFAPTPPRTLTLSWDDGLQTVQLTTIDLAALGPGETVDYTVSLTDLQMLGGVLVAEIDSVDDCSPSDSSLNIFLRLCEE